MQNETQKLTLQEKFAQSKFGKEVISLRDEMKPMTWKQRVDHIWTYYKEYIGLIALLLFISIGLISSMITGSERRNTVVTGIMVNIVIDQDGMNYLSTDYANHLGVKEEKISLEYTSFYDLETNPSEENYYASMIVVNEVSAKMLDYMILDKLGMEFYTGQEVYLDLREFFTLEELKAFAAENRLVFCLEEDTAAGLSEEELYALQLQVLEPSGADITGCWPAAVKISDLAYIKDNVTTDSDIYFALAGSTEKIEEVRSVWNYMNAWKSKK